MGEVCIVGFDRWSHPGRALCGRLDEEAAELRRWFTERCEYAALAEHVDRYLRVHRGRFLQMLGLTAARRPRRLLSIGLSFGLPEIVATRALDVEVLATDYRAEKLDRWAAAARAAGVQVEPLDLLREPASRLVDRGPFDMVWCCEVLEHLRLPPAQVVGELCELLAPGGHLLITVPNAGRWSNVVRLLRGDHMIEPLGAISRESLEAGASVFDRWMHVREPSVNEMASLLRASTAPTMQWQIALPRPPWRLAGSNLKGLFGQAVTVLFRRLRPTIYCLGQLAPTVRQQAPAKQSSGAIRRTLGNGATAQSSSPG